MSTLPRPHALLRRALPFALLVAGSAQANLLSNGGFETPSIGPANAQNVTIGGEPTGFAWKVITNNVDIFSNGVLGLSGAVAEGVQALDLVGFGSTGAIEQSFATVAGQSYRLSFAYANNPISTSTASAAVVLEAAAGTLLSSSVTHNTSVGSNLDWTAFSATFVGTGGAVALRFTNTVGTSNGGIFLDAVDVSPVPEPAAAWLWLTGLPLLGWSVSRRRTRKA